MLYLYSVLQRHWYNIKVSTLQTLWTFSWETNREFDWFAND